MGARFYTYTSTMARTMEAAAAAHLPYVVLDRPNPVGGLAIEGPLLEPDYASFVGLYPVPIRHGFTVGEYAAWMAGEGHLAGGADLDLRVVAMRGWERRMLFAAAGVPWVQPSPNMPTPATALVYLAIPHWTPHLPASRFASLLFVLLITVVVPAWRILYVTIFTQPSFRRRLLIVGAGRSGCEIAHLLAAGAEGKSRRAASGYEMVGFVDDDPDKAGLVFSGVPVLGNRHDLLNLIHEHHIDLIVIALTHSPEIHPDLFRTLLDCREQGVCLEPMTGVYEQLTGKVSVQHAGRDLSVVMPQENSATRHLFSAGKRAIDLRAWLIGLVLVSIIAPIVYLANAIWAPGPLLYRQVRIGRGGKPFHLYKFRSMITTAEDKCGAVWARENLAHILSE